MNEQHLTRGLIRHLNQALTSSVVIKHTDQFTSGIPDLSITWGGSTSWIEVKVVRKGSGILGRGAQTLTLQRLEKAGSSWYVVYHLDPARTMIVRPSQIYGEYWATADASCDGLNHELVADFIKRLHLAARPKAVPA